MTKHKKTSFFYDDSKGNPAELLIDYFMSWTLRCAVDFRQDNISDEVQKSAKCILQFLIKDLIDGETADRFKVLDVETLKQWNNVDLLCSIHTKVGEDEIWYVLAFENKMYTKLHDNQLEGYISSVNERYQDDPRIKKAFIYLTSHAEVPVEDQDQIKEYNKRDNSINFFAYPISELSNYLRKMGHDPTGNALFDEFWHNFY